MIAYLLTLNSREFSASVLFYSVSIDELRFSSIVYRHTLSSKNASSQSDESIHSYLYGR